MRAQRLKAIIAIFGVASFAGAMTVLAQGSDDSPVYSADGKLRFPQNYREWVYLTSGYDMSYAEGGAPSSQTSFDNIFVNRTAYDAFLKTGTWPDKTVLILEARRAEQNGSINKNGHFQTGVTAVEVHVRDRTRYKNGSGFFRFQGQEPTLPLADDTSCQTCHQQHGAVASTFVQFYPTLLPLAQKNNTLSPGYLADEKARAANPKP